MTSLKIYLVKELNPFNAEATFVQSTRMQRFWKPSKPCHTGIDLIALAENFQMSTHVPGFQSFFRYFFYLVLAIGITVEYEN